MGQEFELTIFKELYSSFRLLFVQKESSLFSATIKFNIPILKFSNSSTSSKIPHYPRVVVTLGFGFSITLSSF